MGRRLKESEEIALAHPHLSVAGREMATVVSLPVASIIDRARDLLRPAR